MTLEYESATAPDTPEAMKEEYKQDFIRYRNKYLDDLPQQRLHSGDHNYYLYKCRGNVWQGIATRLSYLLKHQCISDPAAAQTCRNFIQYFQSREREKFFTKKEIDYVNEVLDTAIRAIL